MSEKFEVCVPLLALHHLQHCPVPVVELSQLARAINYDPHDNDEEEDEEEEDGAYESYQAEFWVPPKMVDKKQRRSFFLTTNLLFQSQQLSVAEDTATFDAKFVVAMNCFRSNPIVFINWNDLFSSDGEKAIQREMDAMALLLRTWMQFHQFSTSLACIAAIICAVFVGYLKRPGHIESAVSPPLYKYLVHILHQFLPSPLTETDIRKLQVEIAEAEKISADEDAEGADSMISDNDDAPSDDPNAAFEAKSEGDDGDDDGNDDKMQE